MRHIKAELHLQATKQTPVICADQTRARLDLRRHLVSVDSSVSPALLEAEQVLNETQKKAPVGTRLEVRGYLLLIELQPGSIEQEAHSPTGVHQTPPVLGERHRERETPH